MEGKLVQLPRRRVRRRRRPTGDDSLSAPPGRAWINGREVGGVVPRFAHLAAAYD